MDNLYLMFYELYRPGGPDSRLSAQELLIHATSDLVVFTQSLHFFWRHDLKISHWNDYEPFWKIISYSSIDNLCSDLGYFDEFLVVILIILSFSLSLMVFCFLVIILKKPLKDSCKFLTKITLKLICHVFFIPIFLGLCQMLVDSSTSRISSGNYSRLKIHFLKNENFSNFFAVLGLAWLVSLTVFNEIACYEVRQGREDKFTLGKINGNNSLMYLMMKIVICCLYSFLDVDYYQVFLIICCGFYAICTWNVVSTLPYYSKNVNIYKTFEFFSLAFVAGSFLIGTLQNNATLTLVLSVFMQPVLACVAFVLVVKREKRLEGVDVNCHLKFWIFELLIRKHLKNPGNLEILTILNKSFTKFKVRENRIVSAFYCLDVLKDPCLALNIIHSISHKGFNIMSNYQVFKCKQIMSLVCSHQSSTFKILKYFQAVQEIYSNDRAFCYQFANFFDTILLKDIKIHSLKKSVSLTFKTWKKLEKNYNNWLSEFPTSEELIQMHRKFQLCIKPESNLSKSLQSVGRSILNNFNSYLKAINENSLFLVSSNPETFGKIIYFNRNFLKMFHLSASDQGSLHIRSIFPRILHKSYEKSMKKFQNKCRGHRLFDNISMLFVNSEGFLFEGLATVEWIVEDENLFFIFSVENSVKENEFAVISEDGLILEHTKIFSKSLESEREKCSNFFIQEFLPELDLKNIEIPLMIKVKTVKSKTVQLRVEQIEIATERIFLLEIFNQEQIDEKFSFKLNDIERTLQQKSSEKFDRTNEKSLKESFNPKDLKKNISRYNNSTSSQQLLNNKELNSYKKSVRIMKLTILIIVILVMDIQALCLISSNIGILVYLSQEVTHSLNLKPLINLNYLSYALVQLALILRTNDLYLRLGKPAYFDQAYFDNIINITKQYQDKLSDELYLWNYCKSSRIVKYKEFHYWDLKRQNSTKMTNLFGFVEFITQNAQKASIKMQQKDNFKEEYMNVISNAHGTPSKNFLKIIDNLIECEVDRVNFINSQKWNLTVIGIAVLSICFLVIFLFLWVSDRFLNDLWEHLRIRSLGQVKNLKKILNERLEDFHCSRLDNSYYGEDSSEPFNFRHSLKSLSKLSFLFIVSAIFLFVSTLYFYDQVKVSLYYRPLILSSVSRRRSLLSSLTFIVVESYADSHNSSLTSYYPEFSDIDNYKHSIFPTTKDLKATGRYVYKQESWPIISDYLIDCIFFRYPNGSSFLYAGSFRSVAYMIRESLYLASNTVKVEFEEINDFIQKMSEFNDAVQIICGRADDDTRLVIESRLSDMTVFITCCSCMLLLLVALFYYPLIRRDISILSNLVKLLEIIPR